jgi:hypothetical protein
LFLTRSVGYIPDHYVSFGEYEACRHGAPAMRTRAQYPESGKFIKYRGLGRPT